jgi:alpha-galactosidase
MSKTKVVVIGAGSAGFGQGAIADMVSCKQLKKLDLEIVLVDIDEDSLSRMHKLALLIKDFYNSKAKITSTPERKNALKDANYVIVSVAKDRWKMWEKDFYIPAAYGFPQVFGENGGPGAAFHTLRSLNIMIPIAEDMEKLCPDAIMLNFTNPESRVCMGISKSTNIKAVGLCHGPLETLDRIGEILEKPIEEIELIVGGLNHFHWALSIKDKRTKKDLYPEISKRIDSFDWQADTLTKRLFKIFGLLTYPAPSHPGEYLNFAFRNAGPKLIDWGIGSVSHKLTAKGSDLDYIIEGKYNRPSYELWSQDQAERIEKAIKGEISLTDREPMLNLSLTDPSRELAVPIICDIEFDLNKVELAANVLNDNLAVQNLPEDAIVEVPIKVGSKGIVPVNVGPLPEPIAGLCNLQISIQKLLVEAYQKKSKDILFQALIIDPIINDERQAKAMMETMIKVQEDHLPALR